MKTRITGIVVLGLGLGLGLAASAPPAFRTARLEMALGPRGEIVRLADPMTQRNYAPDGPPGYLLRVKDIDGRELVPSSVRVKKDLLTFAFDGGIVLTVRAAEKADYLRFELVGTVRSERIGAVLWGPILTTIGGTIGEVVGVVRSADLAIGIQALNAKTCGGKLVNEEGTTGGRTTAAAEPFGSSLQAFCVNQARDRVMTVWNLYKNVPVKALPGFKLEGSALAVFAAAPAEVLPLIGRLERAEGLPHPVIDGRWIKTSGAAGRPYLIASFGEKDVDILLEYARRLGFAALYHSGPFKTWGHYDLLEDLFPNGRAGFKACVDKGRALGLRVGAHTLTNFVTTNDPFVTTDANRGLMAAGVARLVRDVDAATTEIAVDGGDVFKQEFTLNSVLLGAEIVRFRSVAGDGPYTLTGCVRGAFGTAAAAHPTGAEARMLMDHPYKTFFPDGPMQDELIGNLARFFRETGASQMDFDGHEGTCYLGRGEYGHVRFVEDFLGQVGHPVVNGSSNIGHYYWHFNSYINWGEPWYASFRESQSRYRFDNQPFLERNYLPNMLGWFLMTPDTRLEDIEWMAARAAGYRAGYAFVAESETFRKNPATEAIVESIRSWEEAKERGVFTDEQRARLKDPERDFHLERAGEGRWTLRNYEKLRFEHARKVLQPGQPTGSTWDFENAFGTQPLRLQITLAGGDGARAEAIEIEVDRSFRVAVPGALKAGQSLVWDGAERMIVYDDKGRKVADAAIGQVLPPLQKGPHSIAVDARLGGADPVLKGTVKLEAAAEAVGRQKPGGAAGNDAGCPARCGRRADQTISMQSP